MYEKSDRGIIWQVQPFQEKDLLLTILSEQNGKLRLVAKGARGLRAKRKGLLQSFSLLRFAYIPTKNPQGLGKLTRTEFEFTPQIAVPAVWAEAMLLMEVSQRLLISEQVIPGVFALWEDFLKMEFREPLREVCGFLVQFMSRLGLFPEFRCCTKCGTKFREDSHIIWQDGAGISCCGQTNTAENSSEFNLACKQLSFAELKSLYFFQHTAPQNFAKLGLSTAEATHLLQIIFQELKAFSEKPFVSKEVFEELVR